jgi:hypothetical protein
MERNNEPLTGETIIEVGKSISPEQFREYFYRTLGEKFNPRDKNLYLWMSYQTGKTLSEAVENYGKHIETKNMNDILLEKRFDNISKSNKDFIISFDKEVGTLGYDFGGHIGSGHAQGNLMIIYKKKDIKSSKVIARILIRDDCIILKLILGNVEKHSSYISNAPKHIKDIFIGDFDDCRGCNTKTAKCRRIKKYNINGKIYEKCSEKVFRFIRPVIENLPDYIDLIKEFYPIKTIHKKINDNIKATPTSPNKR